MSEVDLSEWKACASLGRVKLDGTYCMLEPFDSEKHELDLFSAVGGPGNDDLWTYIPMGPFTSAEDLNVALAHTQAERGWDTMVIRDVATNNVLGMASYMRQRPDHGSVEVGCIVFSHALQRTRVATETIYLMASHVFDDLGYRRFEWKCNAANAPSMRAAVRFGFTFEGIFRNDMVIKGANRDTAWYSIIDNEWPEISAEYQRWLRPDNFASDGEQITKLKTATRS
jgi:RimJ/RimL family protein N-acetyltransferase